MTFDHQLRWLRAEQRTCQRILAEGLRRGFGCDIQVKTRHDLAVLEALRQTLQGAHLGLWKEEEQGVLL